MGLLERSIKEASLPIKAVNSSCTILTINCPGLMALITFAPMAFSLILSVNSLAILKLTSASNKAFLISFKVLATFKSLILACPFRCLNADSNFSLKLLNILTTLRGAKISDQNESYTINSKGINTLKLGNYSVS